MTAMSNLGDPRNHGISLLSSICCFPVRLDSFLSSGRHHPFLMPQACKLRLTFPSLSRWPQLIIGLAKMFAQDFGNFLQKSPNELFGQPDMSEKIKFRCHMFPNSFPLHLKESLLSFHDLYFLSQRREYSQSLPR